MGQHSDDGVALNDVENDAQCTRGSSVSKSEGDINSSSKILRSSAPAGRRSLRRPSVTTPSAVGSKDVDSVGATTVRLFLHSFIHSFMRACVRSYHIFVLHK